MADIEDFRFKSHDLLIQLDSATTAMMLLVARKEVSGPAWDEASRKHQKAYEAWLEHVNTPSKLRSA